MCKNNTKTFEKTVYAYLQQRCCAYNYLNGALGKMVARRHFLSTMYTVLDRKHEESLGIQTRGPKLHAAFNARKSAVATHRIYWEE